MQLGLAFWIIFLIWIILGLVGPFWGPPWGHWPGFVLELLLLFILGWKVFGPPLHG